MDVRAGLSRKLASKNWCFWTVVLEKTLESPLDCKEIQPVHPKEDQSWVYIGRVDAEAETPILWPTHAKNWFIGKDPDAGRDWGQEEKGTTEDEIVWWHHWPDAHEFRLKAGGKGDDRGWEGWMASPTWWMWVWVNSGSWWWTGRSGMLQFMGSQRVGHNWATELNWTEQFHLLLPLSAEENSKSNEGSTMSKMRYYVNFKTDEIFSLCHMVLLWWFCNPQEERVTHLLEVTGCSNSLP